VSPLRGEKPQNWPLSKLNTGRFALRAMLPVIIGTFRANRRRREMYSGHRRLCVYICLSVPRRIPTLLHAPGCDLGER